MSKGLTASQLARSIDSLGAPVSLQLGKATVRVRIDRERRETENVVGMLDGTDSLLDNQYVVYSAHYDHLGLTRDGAVFHGADDNASGTATVLGIARAYALSAVKPRRSVIFLTVTGEEEGLLGSTYFTSHSPVPLDRIAADINTDMDGRIDPAHDGGDSNYIYVIGSKRLSNELDSLLVAADSESVKLILDYRYDAENDLNRFYYRSDSYSFARHKVPTIFFFNGVHADYHRRSDTSDKIAFSAMEKRAILVFLTGWKVANFSRRLMPN
jgi:Zn-dependent M28 family amino/carboxypeptidase